MTDGEASRPGRDASGGESAVGLGFETLCHPRWTAPRRDDRSGRDAYLPDLDVRPEGGGSHQGFEYSRTGNPTRSALETCLADLEGTTHGAAFASGLAAEDAVFRCLEPGDHVIIGNELYGGTYRLLDQVHSSTGLEFTPVALEDAASIEAVWRPSTRMVWVETPSNPQLLVTDIASVAGIAHGRNALGGSGQHLRYAVPAAARGPRRRHRGPFHHQVPEWAQRCGGGLRRHVE